jgi:hypothetical protein
MPHAAVIAATSQQGLTLAGAVVMIVSVACVLALAGFCVRRILSKPRTPQHMHAPLDIDTHDT